MNPSKYHYIEQFLPGGKYYLLPDRGNPRLIIPGGQPSERWQKSRFYPAYRLPARLFRFFLRLKATSGLNDSIIINQSDDWMFGSFLKKTLPSAASIAIYQGMPGKAKKIVFQIWDDKHVIAYAKYAEEPVARKRLEQEFFILNLLESKFSPRALAIEDYGKGTILITEPIFGHPVPPKLPPPARLFELLKLLYQPESYQISDHPWLKSNVAIFNGRAESWMNTLKERNWPSVMMHGDFAPWNILRVEDNRWILIDWEYGVKDGFPFVDLCHYLMQTGLLIYRWSPQKTKKFSIDILSQIPWPGLSRREADAVINLSALYTYEHFNLDGLDPQSPVQKWRRSIWEEKLDTL